MVDYIENEFYWIKLEGKWEPAMYYGNGYWHLIHSDYEWHNSDIEEIGEACVRHENNTSENSGLNLCGAINCIDLDPDFVEALNQLINTQIKPTKKRF